MADSLSPMERIKEHAGAQSIGVEHDAADHEAIDATGHQSEKEMKFQILLL
ncbi:hypothetical protein [Sinorhizobium sp. A49]|uniref:hypothetical protein n=1 Tax=Sinorhizobium sp. A49 TaxID=1945861 RepID=UPI0015C525D8|nr:hypothetical protein [Sinorhizobium sp. A49]